MTSKSAGIPKFKCRNMNCDNRASGVHGRIHWKSSVTEPFSKGIPELGNFIRMKKVHFGQKKIIVFYTDNLIRKVNCQVFFHR